MNRDYVLAAVVIGGVVIGTLTFRAEPMRARRPVAQTTSAAATQTAAAASGPRPQPAAAPTAQPPVAVAATAVERDGDHQQEEEEEKRGPDGHPRPVGADHPEAAAEFRRLSLMSEDGSIVDNGLMIAAQQAAELRGQSPEPGAEPGAGISRGSWTWLGPGNIGGRVRAIVIHPTNTNTMFAGGVDGGIWKTTDGGTTWAPVDDFMANLAVSSIVMAPGNPSVMYAGTGEGFYNSDGIRGAGIFKSTDGGTTWTQLASTANASFYYVNRLAMSPDGNTILAATRSGVLRSTNGGTSWSTASVMEATDVNFHPTDSSRAVVSGYNGDAAYSTDGGATFTAASGLPPAGFRRVEIAYAPSSPTTVYASVDVNGGSLYVSTDGGANYTLRFSASPDYLGGQGWYGNALWVNPFDANNLIVGGIDLYKSTDGGTTFVKISDWSWSPLSAHADHHMIVSHPGFNNTSNRTVFFGNDGGVYRATDSATVGGGGAANCSSGCTSGWTSLNNNLGVTQFYGAGGNPGSGVVVGGTQDNGTLKYTPGGGVNGWTTVFGGDGGWSAVDPSNPNIFYGEYVYLTLHRSLTGGASDWINGLYWNGSSYVCKPIPYRIGDGGGTDGCSPTSYGTGANFIAPFVLDPNNSNRLLAGGVRLWRTNDATTPNTSTTGPSWASIKPNIGSNISAIAIAKLNSDVVWVGHSNGNVYSTSNGTAGTPTWTQRDNGATPLPNRYVTRVTVDPNDASIVYVAFGGFSSDNLWRSLDGGATWSVVVGSGGNMLPAAPVRDLEVNPNNSNWLYAATEVGIFVSENGGATWMAPHDGPANVSVDELFFMGGDLVAVTHGRGVFKQTVGATAPPVSGRVTDASSGTGLSGIAVNFYNSSNVQVAVTSTNASGDYTLTLAPGTYYARTTNAFGYINKVYDNLACVSACNPTLGTPVVVSALGASNINFALNAGARIAGTVTVNGSGAAINGMTVWIVTSTGDVLTTATSDASGNYLSNGGLAAGNYYVRTTNTMGFVDEAYNNVVCLDCSAHLVGTPVSVSGTATTSGINFALDLSGHIAGTVTTVGGVPISGVTVQVYNASGTLFTTVSSNTSGSYVTSATMPPGTYYARTGNGLGYVNELYDNLECALACNVIDGRAINVSPGATSSGVNFSLSTGGRLSGRVTNAAGVGLSGVTVSIVSPNGSSVLAVGTDSQGNFATTTGLPPGTYFARTSNTQGYVDEVFNNIPCPACTTGTQGTPIALIAGVVTPNINFALDPGGVISGRITNASTSAGLSGATALVYSPTRTLITSVTADASGNYSTSAGLPPGTYYVRSFNTQHFIDEVYNNVTCVACDVLLGAPVTVTAGATTTGIDLALTPGGGVISGTIIDSSTSLAAAVTVSVVNSAGDLVTTVSTNASGYYETGTGLTAGNYFARTNNTVGLINEAYNNITCLGCDLLATTPIAVSLGATTSGINFALDPGARISGTVVSNSTGQPMAGVAVSLYTMGGTGLATAATRANGTYSILTGVPSGAYAARTTNAGAFVYEDQLYNNIPCLAGCTPANGTPINMTAPNVTPNINFSLLTATPRLTISEAMVAAGAPVTVTLRNGLGGASDWMALALSSAADTTYLQYTYVGAGVTNRVWTFNAPNAPGQYEVRLFQNNGYTRLATSPIITVVPGLSINDVSRDEGQSGVTNFTFSLNLSAPSPLPVSVSYSTANGTATAGSDYTATSGSLNISAGATSASITVPVLGDTTFEPNETFTLTLSNPVNAMLTRATATGTILADDGGPTLAIDDVSVVEGDSGTTAAVFTVTLSPAAAGNVTVNFVTVDSTATAPSDYTTTSGTLAFAPGQQIKTISVPVVGDVVTEPNETFFVDLSNASVNAVIGDSRGVGTIINDEGPRLTLTQSSAAAGSPVTVNLVNGQGGATDWIAFAKVGATDQTYLTWTYVGAGVTSRAWTIPMPPVPAQYEFRLYPSGSFTRLATSPAISVLPGMVISDASVVEGNSGTANLAFTVTLSAPSPNAVTVQYGSSDLTATAGSDYTAVSGSLNFSPGDVSRTIIVPVSGDTTFEPTETMTVTLANVTNAILTDATGTGTIVNDDTGPTLTINDVSVVEGDSGTVNAVFTVTLNPLALTPVTVDYATANLSANASSDYVATSGTLTFPGNVSSQTITVPVIGDMVLEPNETFAVNLFNASVNAAIGDAQGIGTIVNDEGPRLTPSATSVAAGAGVTISLNNSPGGATDWMALAPVGAPDLQYSSWTYVGAGVNSRSWSITMPTLPGNYEVRLFASNTFTRLATSPAISVLPGLNINDVSRVESHNGSSNFVFSVSLTPASSQTVTVQYATADGTATAGSDYTAASGLLTFAPGTTVQTISVPVIGDTTFEPDETFTVVLSNPSNALLADGTGLGTIRNDDTGPTLAINDPSILEGDSGTVNLTFTVTLTPAAGSTVTVDYATANGTATAGPDYTAASGTVTFAAGETSKTFNVAVLGDLLNEGNETFLVNLSNASVNAAIGDGQGVGTILNDDGPRITPSVSTASAGSQVTFTLNNSPGGPADWMALAPVGAPVTTYSTYVYVGAGVTSRQWTVTMPPVPQGNWEARLFANNGFELLAASSPVLVAPGLAINDVGVIEGNSGNTTATFIVSLSAPSSQTVTVQYATSNGTATAGSDYIAAAGTLTFNPGVTQQPIVVSVLTDTTFEPNETFNVTLSSPANALIGDGTGVGTILNDDQGPTLSVNDASILEGNSGTINLTFTVSLTPAAASTVTVDYATANGTAIAGSDFTATTGTLSFAAGETSKTFTVPVIGDFNNEGNETFLVNLANASVNAAIGDGQGVGTILNDDGPRITPSATTVPAGGSVTFTLNSSPGGAGDWMALAPVGAPATTYTTYIYVGAGVTSRAWTVNMPLAPLGNWEARLFADNGFVQIANSAAVSVVAGASINDVSVIEGNSGNTTASFTVMLSAPSSQTVSLQYATSNGTATAGSDYIATSGTLTFNPGVVQQSIVVPVLVDTTFEPNETFTVTLSNPVNAVLSDGTGIGTILNDDAGPTLSVNDASVLEGDTGSAAMTFTVSLTPAAAATVTVDYATANGTAIAGADYTAAAGTLTFAAGETSKTFTVAVIGDFNNELNETFLVNLSNASVNAAIGDGQGVGTIFNDDGPRIIPSVSTSPAGGAVTFTLNNTPGGPGDWVALAPVGAPFTTYATYTYVGPGVTSRTWTVNMPTTPLGNWEARLFADNGFNLITNSAPVNVVPGLAVNDVSVAEGNSGNTTASFTVSLSAPNSQTVTVQYATSNGTATAGSDYIAASGTLTFNPGVVQQSIVVPILVDTTFEPNETFNVTLSSPTNAVLSDASGVGTILNDDQGPTLSVNDASITEGDSGTTNMTFTVSLTPAAAATVTVNYATANGTATAGSDYTAALGTLTFAAGETSKTFTVAVIGDLNNELNETFLVNLSNASVNAAIGDGQGVGTILNDDGPRIIPSVSTAPAGGAVTFTLNNTPGGPGDWVALAPVGAPFTTYATYTYVGAGVTSRTWTVNMPATPLGNWEARLFADNGFTLIANSAAVNVVPGIAVNDVSVTEGNSGNSSASFTVSLSAPSSQTVTVQYATANGSATAGSDYVAVSGTLTFNPGVTQQPIVVPILADTTFEPNETFNISLSTATNAVLSDAIGVGTIINDDAGPTLSVNDASITEGDSGSANMTFTVTLSPAAASTVTVDYATANGTATAGSDYVATNGTLTFAPGDTSKTFTVTVLGDLVVEVNETFVVNLSNVSASAAIGDGQGVGTIVTDDGPRILVSPSTAAAGSSVVATVSNAPGGAQDWLAVAPVGAPNTTYLGYTYVGAGVTSRNWSAPMPNAVGQYEIRLFLNNGYTLAATSPAITLVPGLSVPTAASFPEGSTNGSASINVTLSPASASTVTVNYATSDGTATAGSDYAATSGTLTFPAGTTTRTIVVPLFGDTAVEPDETFIVTLSSPSNALLALSTTTVTIANDDATGPCTDSDGDRLCNTVETNTGVFVSATNTGTNPFVADTDGDGILDGDEVLGTLGGLNLPGMGANPLRKNILFEYDWIDDSYYDPVQDGGSCGAHSHRPSQSMLDRVSASFAAAPLSNPDGTTGITLIHDYGQGGLFTGGSMISHAPNLTGGVNGADFIATKNANFQTNRSGYFHYVLMAHWYTDSLGSSGQAELPGDDLTVTLGCYITTNNVANTIMHEAGHNFNIRHGGFENCNWKPNYNSVMNYRFQFPGVDTSCNAIGNSGESNVLDYSRGTRINLVESALNENAGVCGATPIDWNFSGVLQSNVSYDLNRTSSVPSGVTGVDNSGCSAALSTLQDQNDWANMSFLGLADSDGNSLLGMWLYYAQEVVTESNPIPGAPLPRQQQ